MRCSVVIASFNRLPQLAKTLEALSLQQTLSSIEIVICDDGSTPPISYRWARKLAGPHKVVVVRQDHNDFRAGAARNLGWKLADGEVVIFLDDDMICPSDFVEKHAAIHDQLPRRVVFGTRIRIPYSKWSRLSTLELLMCAEHPPGEVFSPTADILAAYPWMWFCSCNSSIRKEFLELSGGFDEQFIGWGCEDTELAYRLYAFGLEFIPIRVSVPYHLEEEDWDVTSTAEKWRLPENKYVAFLRNASRFAAKYRDDHFLQELLAVNRLRLVAAHNGANLKPGGFL